VRFRCASCVIREAKEQKTQSKKLWDFSSIVFNFLYEIGNARYEAVVAGFSPGLPGEGKNLWRRRD
jgi:hypothetical protein